MKYIKTFLLLIFVLSINISVSAQAENSSTFKWYTWDEMIEAQKTNPKKVMIDMYTDWCGWCKKMDKTTFADAEVQAYLEEHFYAVKFDAEQKESIHYDSKEFKFVKSGRRGVHELAYALLDGKLSYPSIVYLNEEIKRVVISPGFKDSNKFMKELTYLAGEHYKTTKFQDYINKSK